MIKVFTESQTEFRQRYNIHVFGVNVRRPAFIKKDFYDGIYVFVQKHECRKKV
jgi:hypothetical protein